MSREAVFALYRGDEFVDVGTKEELARKMGVKPSSISFMATPAYRRRNEGNENRLMAYRLEEDEEDDER